MGVLYVDLVSGADVTAKTITGATKANPCVVTATSHGFSNGDEIYIWNVAGMIQLNGNRYVIANVAANTFELSGVDSTSYTTYSSAGYATPYGTAALPMLTLNAANGRLVAGVTAEIRVAKTAAYTSVGGATFGWTSTSTSVTTSADVRASIAVGDYIGKTTAAGNGAEETFYRVNAITAATITLEQKYQGSTATEATCNKLVVVTTGVAGATAMTSTVNGLVVSGGWNLSNETQDGETWFKSNNARTVAIYGINATLSTSISKINIVETNCGVYASGTLQYCTCNALAIGRQVQTTATNTTDNCNLTAAGTSYHGFYGLNLIACSVTNCFLTGPGGIKSLAPTLANIITGNKFWGAVGIANEMLGPQATVYNNQFLYNLTYAIGSVLDNTVIDTCQFTGCAHGMYELSQGLRCFTAKNCTFTSIAGYAIRFLYQRGVVVDGCTFTNCSYGIGHDGYSADLTVRGCTFTTPTNYAIHRVASSAGPIYVYNSTIDGASIAKAYNISASGDNIRQYVFQNAFGQSGTIWGAGSVLKDSSVYRVTPPSVSVAWFGTTTKAQLDVKVASAYVAASASKTYTMWIKASSASWAGTLTPKWKLDGATIKTESNVTSLTTSWVQYSWTCSGGLITSDGELSLEFTPNMSAHSFYVDDFTIS